MTNEKMIEEFEEKIFPIIEEHFPKLELMEIIESLLDHVKCLISIHETDYYTALGILNDLINKDFKDVHKQIREG